LLVSASVRTGALGGARQNRNFSNFFYSFNHNKLYQLPAVD
jgi:hypothetical protein